METGLVEKLAFKKALMGKIEGTDIEKLLKEYQRDLSRAGGDPLHPGLRAYARRAARGDMPAWPGFYRRSATGLAARGSGAASRRLHSKDRHSATGLMAR